MNSPSAQEKALSINLDGAKYGTIAEIGAGQEVVRWFFHVGKASATVAKSISAYDMAISNGLYGPTPHYVSRARLESMLDTEFGQLAAQLDPVRGERSSFFVFADTIATHTSSRLSGGHGWLGVRFQPQPRAEPSEIIIHIELSDTLTANRQEAVGLVGVNLIYGAFTSYQDPVALIHGLMDGLDRRRVEIDMIKFSGPVFSGVDNRLIALQLVEQGLTDAAMFTAAGEVVQPSEILHGRPVVVERGSFRPVTNVIMAMMDAAVQQIAEGAGAKSGDPVVVMEMTLKNLMSGPSIDHQDFLARADTLGALDKLVAISSHTRFDTVTTYLRQYTQEKIGFVAGVPTVTAIFDEQYYQSLDGGILEGLGRLFKGPVTLFAYPTLSAPTAEIESADKLAIRPELTHLYAYLFENGFIVPVRDFDLEQLHVTPADVLKKIQAGDPTWADYVPAPAAEVIRKKKLFGCAP